MLLVCVYIYEYIIKGVEYTNEKEEKKRKKERMECLQPQPGHIILTRPLDVWRDVFLFFFFCAPRRPSQTLVLLSCSLSFTYVPVL